MVGALVPMAPEAWCDDLDRLCHRGGQARPACQCLVQELPAIEVGGDGPADKTGTLTESGMRVCEARRA